jgi:hypothetical protein
MYTYKHIHGYVHYKGDPKDGLGYINLSGFNNGAGRDLHTYTDIYTYKHMHIHLCNVYI